MNTVDVLFARAYAHKYPSLQGQVNALNALAAHVDRTGEIPFLFSSMGRDEALKEIYDDINIAGVRG